jgi:hypothetical protein
MKFSKHQIDAIYQRTTGYCHLCHKKLSRKNYGKAGTRGAWHVEHSIPKANGGTNHMNNLFPACIRCNCKKGSLTTRMARGWNGKTCAPVGPAERKKLKFEGGIAGAVAGGLTGGVIAGPVGAFIGAITGASMGYSGNPDRV